MTFKALYCGAEYHNIDGTGWPDAVVMENMGSVFDGTYESKRYYPERTCHDLNGPNTRSFICSECGESTMKDCCDPLPRYCANCGARVVS